MRLHKDSRPYKILKYLLLAGGFIVLSSVSPLAGVQLAKGLVKEYFRKKAFKKELFLRDLKRLQTRKIVDYRVLPDGKIEVVLGKRGKQYKLVYDFDNLQLNKERWDGKWRIVMFDIPDYKRKARDALRSKLISLGLYPVQESVFLTPYECEKRDRFYLFGF